MCLLCARVKAKTWSIYQIARDGLFGLYLLPKCLQDTAQGVSKRLPTFLECAHSLKRKVEPFMETWMCMAWSGKHVILRFGFLNEWDLEIQYLNMNLGDLNFKILSFFGSSIMATWDMASRIRKRQLGDLKFEFQIALAECSFLLCHFPYLELSIFSLTWFQLGRLALLCSK